MTRSDVHRPVEMDPADYTFVGAFDPQTGDPGARGAMPAQRYDVLGVTVMAYSPVGAKKAALDELLSTKGFVGGNYDTKGSCDHCGARFRYTAVLRHDPTDTYIAVGETCLDNRFALESKAQFDKLRKDAALDRQAQRIKTAAREFMEHLDGDIHIALSRETDLSETFGLDGYALSTITDIRNKLWNSYGSLSEKQVAFVGRLLVEGAVRAVEQAQREAERAAETRVPAPVGRQAIEGTVVSRKIKEGDYGSYVKLVLVCGPIDARFAVYVTEPNALRCERGDILRATVTLTRSDRDESFAFGKSPKSAEIVGRKSEAEMAEGTSLDALPEGEW